MNARFYTLGASGNPLVQALSLLVFGVVLIGAVLMGAVVLAVVFGLAVVGAIAFSVRLWWLRRKLQRQASARGESESAPGSRWIEAEYTVVSEREPHRRPRGRR